jgi:hypothetical protein
MPTVCDLLCARQRELFSRYQAIHKVCREDPTIVEDILLASLIEELDVHVELAHTWLSEHAPELVVERDVVSNWTHLPEA